MTDSMSSEQGSFDPKPGGGKAVRLRVFVSSPGDVSEERVVAERVIERINARFRNDVEFSAVLWEHEPLRASSTPQADVPSPDDCDFVICLLWSRLGTRLPANITRPDGSIYNSGTEYEFETALNAWKSGGTPHLLVYRKTAESRISLADSTNVLNSLRQKELVDSFFNKWFSSEDGSLPRAFHLFESADEFEMRLEQHLVKLVEQELTSRGISISWRQSWEGNPFRGLETFESKHKQIFFGRTRQVSEILDAVRGQAERGRRKPVRPGAQWQRQVIMREGGCPADDDGARCHWKNSRMAQRFDGPRGRARWSL